MTRWLETDTYSNKDISTAVSVGVYTADADRLILVQVFADQVAGNGDYDIYLTHRINGAGSSYRMIPITTAAAASGVTAIAAQSGMIAVRSGDVLTVYLDGLAGDNSTPDTTVRWFELAALRPTTADRTLDVSPGGEAGVDWSNVGSPTTTVNLSGTSTKANEAAPLDAAGTRTAMGLSAANLDTQLGALQADVDAIRAVTDAIDTSAVTVTTSNDAGALTCYRAVTFNATVSGLTISASWTKVYLTVKTDLDLADSASTIQVVETNPGAGTDGLLYLNGAAPTGGITYADAALVVTQAAGTVAIALSDNMTAQLERGASLHWDLKQIVSGVTSGVLASGTFDVALTPTRTI